MKALKPLLLATAGLLLEGCVLWDFPPSADPVIENSIGKKGDDGKSHKVGTIATVAQRRLAIVKYDDGKFCAEPPPDAVDNVSSAIAAAASLGAKGTQAEAELANNFASNAVELGYRSQGLQLYRDAMFALCNEHVNGAISNGDLRAMHTEILTVANKLIDKELTGKGFRAARTTSQPPKVDEPRLPARKQVAPAEKAGDADKAD